MFAFLRLRATPTVFTGLVRIRGPLPRKLIHLRRHGIRVACRAL